MRTAINPLYCTSRGAEALGYARRSSPARAVADYFCKDHQPAGGAHQHPYRSAFYFGYTLRSPPVRALLDLPRLPGSAGVLTGVGFLGSPVCHFPFQASGRPTPPSPLVGEGGRGMRGKSASECRKSLISPKKSTLERCGHPALIERPRHDALAPVTGRTAACRRDARAPGCAGTHTVPARQEHPRTTCVSHYLSFDLACAGIRFHQ